MKPIYQSPEVELMELHQFDTLCTSTINTEGYTQITLDWDD